MTQDPIKRRGIDEAEMKNNYPKTYIYLRKFEDILRNRPLFKRYYSRKDKYGKIYPIAPFYSIFGVGKYTLSPYKVVWPNIGNKITASVVAAKYNKPIIPQHIITLVPTKSLKEAHFICALMNSSPINFLIQSYSIRGGKSFADPHVLENVKIPKFNPLNRVHNKLAFLSIKAHALSKKEEKNRKNSQLRHSLITKTDHIVHYS